jgi:alkylation response protein AidB-like acyl-CoA dehydrogenase
VDFGFTQEQTMLRDLVRELLQEKCSTRAVRQVMETPEGYDPSLWSQLAEMGLPGLAIPTEHGGQGLGMVELALVLEEMGRAVYPGPFFATVVLAGTALASAGSEQQMAEHVPAIAAGQRKATVAWLEHGLDWHPRGIALPARRDGDGWVLDGAKQFVPFADAADLILVAARTRSADDPREGITVFAVDRRAPGLEVRPVQTMDLTARDATVTLGGVRVGSDAVVGQVDQGWSVLDPTLQRAAVAACAEMLGCARISLEKSVEYSKTREQFGQPIGSFQAIKHTCAEMLMDVETSHGATYYAAWAQDARVPDARLAASSAKAFVSEAARRVCGSAIQVHGGIGFTWEYDLHLWFKRAKHLEPFYGDADFHRQQVLKETLAGAGSSSPTPVLA